MEEVGWSKEFVFGLLYDTAIPLYLEAISKHLLLPVVQVELISPSHGQ